MKWQYPPISQLIIFLSFSSRQEMAEADRHIEEEMEAERKRAEEMAGQRKARAEEYAKSYRYNPNLVIIGVWFL